MSSPTMSSSSARLRASARPLPRGATFAADLTASLVVFLVALPLCMGIAIASGVPPVAGLISGIIGGIVVGALAGSPLQVSGPAAGLAVIIFNIVQAHGLAALAFVALVAGALQFAAGLARLGQWFRAVSPAVIHGMLAGIGVLILASQFHVMVDDAPRPSGLANLLSIPEAIYKGIMPLPESTVAHREAAALGLLTILAIVLWQHLAPKRLRFLPGPLLGVLLASTVLLISGWEVNTVQVPANLFAELSLHVPALSDFLNRTLVIEAIAVAVIASAETLLSASAVDQLHDGPRTDYDKELRAQGVGNMLCGLFGALPMTGVIVRSSANVNAGAKTRLSAILHAVWLLLLVAAFPVLLRQIPTAALGAILVYIGYKLVNPAHIRELREHGWGEVIIYGATVVGIVAIDLLVGVGIGVGLTLLKLVWSTSRLGVIVDRERDSNVRVVRLLGSATFLGLPTLARELESIPRQSEVLFDLTQLSFIDPACKDLLRGFEKRHRSMGGSVDIDWNALHALAYGHESGNGKGDGQGGGGNGASGAPTAGAGVVRDDLGPPDMQAPRKQAVATGAAK